MVFQPGGLTFYHGVSAWFRIIQTLCVFTVILDLIGLILILVYLLDEPRKKIYEKDTGRMFIIDSILMLASGELYAYIVLNR